MHDRNISATVVSAFALWFIGLSLAVTNVFIEPDIGGLAMVVAAAGATITVRGFFCQLLRREQAAFDLGREVGRGENGSLRRV